MLRREHVVLAVAATAGAALAGPVSAPTAVARPAVLTKAYGEAPGTARNVAVIVPGADTTARTFDGGRRAVYSTPGGAARALLAEARTLAPEGGLAAIAWLGYASPRTVSLDVLTDTAAKAGVAALRRTVGEVRAANPAARIVLLCHSYGSVLCAKAVPGLGVSDLVVYGSPGLGADSAADLALGGTRLWAGLGGADWMRNVPKCRLGPLGFGPDPAAPGFGATVFATGRATHSEYFKPGGVSLRNLTLIALGRTGEVTHA
ncbi:alpha/beta hydrolase [Spongiactinospora sp. 9N601]|uniref:alpha/beta hydrolase n=1 Tax=Spongiactinospora sp. 9N601 TaxID=3375149 RepID=UPI0037A05231